MASGLSDDELQVDAEYYLNLRKQNIEEAEEKEKKEWYWYCRSFLPKAGYCSKSKWVSKHDPTDRRTSAVDAFSENEEAFGLTILRQEREDLIKKIKASMKQYDEGRTGGRFEIPKDIHREAGSREAGSSEESSTVQNKRHGATMRDERERFFKMVKLVKEAWAHPNARGWYDYYKRTRREECRNGQGQGNATRRRRVSLATFDVMPEEV